MKKISKRNGLFLGLALGLILILLLTNIYAFGLQKFADGMKERGYNVELTDIPRSEVHFLNGKIKSLEVGKEKIVIHTYGSSIFAWVESLGLRRDGWGFRGTAIDWVDKPHFYRKGKLIIQYIGRNDKILTDLEDILGEQVAGDE